MPDTKQQTILPTKMPRGPLNYDQRVWAVEQYNLVAAENAELKAWIDQLPPGMKPPGWPNPTQEAEVKETQRLGEENESLQTQLDDYELGYDVERSS